MDRDVLSSTERYSPFSFYPPLYTTPPQQRSPSPSSFSPSPYVLNFKRRCPKVQQQNRGSGSVQASADTLPQQQRNVSSSGQNKDSISDKSQDDSDGFADEAGTRKREGMAVEVSTESEAFEMEINLLSGRSRKGHLKMDLEAYADGGTASSSVFSLNELEFFDAPDSAFSDSASEDEACPSSIKPEGSVGRLFGKMTPRLQEEIARRIKAEEDAALLEMRWNEMAKRCSSIGLSISFEAGEVLGTPHDEVDPSELLCQKLLVARLVGGAIASAVVRAEKEEELEGMLAAKNREISRLWDKLQYLELINREMSQRNQEVTEITQRRRRRRRWRQKCVVGCFCAAFCIGTAGLVCYKVFPWELARAWSKSFNRPSPNGPSTTELYNSQLCRE